MGLDSLALTQIAQALQQTFSVKISLRQLMESCPTLETLVAHLEESMPKPDVTAPAPAPTAASAPPRR
jgi:acyl carrier protein